MPFSLIILVGVILSGTGLFLALIASPFLRGYDAYYYALQAKFFSVSGAVKIPDGSPIHRIVGLFNRAGLSIEDSYNLWLVISISIGVLLFWFILRKRASYLQLLALMAAVILSPSLLFLTIQFPKMALATMIMPLWFIPILKNQRLWPLSLLAAAISVFFHISLLPLAGLFCAALVLTQIRGALRIILIVATIVGVSAGAFFYLERIDTSSLTWRCGIVSLVSSGLVPSSVIIETLLAAVLLIISIGYCRPSLRKNAPLFILLVPAICPLPESDVFGASLRFALMVSLICWIGIALSIRAPQEDKKPHAATLHTAGILMAALTVLQPLRLTFSFPPAFNPPYESYFQVVDEIKNEEIEMLIAAKPLAYLYKYRLMREAFPYDPEETWDLTATYRVLSGISPEELSAFLDPECSFASGKVGMLETKDFALIREDCWQKMRVKLVRSDNEDLFERATSQGLNPSKKRPAFLLKKYR